MFKQTVGFVTLWLGAHAGSTRLAVLLDEVAHTRPSVFSLDKTDSLVLTGMSSEDMVVLVSEYAETEVGGVGDINAIIVTKVAC